MLSANSIIQQIYTYFKFDCFAPGTPRWQWVHKEEREFHGPSDVRSYSIPVIPICAEDFVEISVTIMSSLSALCVTHAWERFLNVKECVVY